MASVEGRGFAGRTRGRGEVADDGWGLCCGCSSGVNLGSAGHLTREWAACVARRSVWGPAGPVASRGVWEGESGVLLFAWSGFLWLQGVGVDSRIGTGDSVVVFGRWLYMTRALPPRGYLRGSDLCGSGGCAPQWIKHWRHFKNTGCPARNQVPPMLSVMGVVYAERGVAAGV